MTAVVKLNGKAIVAADDPRWENRTFVIDTITDALKNREEVAFTGFGKFTTQHRAARQGVNPRNPSEKVQIPAAWVPKFSAGSSLKQAVRGSSGGGGMM